MANTNSDLATKQAAAKLDPSAGVINMDDACGTVLYATAKVTIPATPAVNDTITIIPAELLPIGAVVIPQLSSVYLATDPGTALILDIGLVSDPDCYADALSLSVAATVVPIATCATLTGSVRFDQCASIPAYLVTPHRILTQEAIIATVKTSTAVDETVAIFTIAYRAKA